MHLDPKCKKLKHRCKKLCISEQCTIQNPFVCDECGSHHKQACNIVDYKTLVYRLNKLQGLNKKDLFKYEEYVEQTFKTLIKSLQTEFVKFRQHFEHINVTFQVAQFYQSIKSNRQNELTAKKVFKMLNDKFDQKTPYKLKSETVMWSLSTELIELQKKVNSKIPNFYKIYHTNQQNQEEEELNSTIPQMKEVQNKFRYYRDQLEGGLLEHNIQTFEKIIEKQVYNIQLLYRASQHQFSAQAFHTACDGKINTLTIAKTQFGNMVGAYSAVSWHSPKSWQYEDDPSNKTFLFSFGKYFQGLKFVPFKRKFTIGMHRQYGPSFGDDLVIHDKSSTSKNCWSNFPDCYVCKQKKIEHNQRTIKQWVGVDDHFKKFNIVEWQVYKVSFNRKQQQEQEFMVEYRKI